MQEIKVKVVLTEGYRERFTEAVCKRVVTQRKRESNGWNAWSGLQSERCRYASTQGLASEG